jgi:outer membrane protein assembly factor BamB
MKRLLFAFVLPLLGSTVFAANWPAWRGPLGTGITEEKDLPTKWSKTENVKWQVPLPEPGNSTPVVWGDRIFLTQAVGERRTVMCLSRADGKVLWQQGVTAKENEPTHPTNPYASQSPVTDGERVIVAFASDGLFCYDMDGKEQWSRTDLGQQIHIWGAGTSPVIRGDLCFLNFGPGATTYLLAVDKKTGRTIWKHDEDIGYGQSSKEHPQYRTGVGSWSTPVFMNVEGKEQLLMSWPRRLAAYDPATGKELWTCAGLTPLVYSSPIYGDGIAVAMSGFSGSAMAVRAGGSGDVTESRRLWLHPRSPQRIGSGVVHEGHIYIHNDPGTAMCLDLKTGDLIWQEKLRGGANWSSVMLSGDKCYTMTQGGNCLVFRASPQFELISENTLGERSNSSVVPSNGELFLRTHRSLWCIAEKR